MSSKTIPSVVQAPILVVEDSRMMRAMIVSALEDAGLPTMSCGSGEAALELAFDGRDRFDAIVLDVTLPGKDGYEVLEELQRDSRTASIPVLLVTADATASTDVVRSMRGGAADHLSKPFDPSVLVAKVEAVCVRRRTERELRLQLEAAQAAQEGQSARRALPSTGDGGVGERYQILGRLGEGASAVVYEAMDVELGEKVALKIFQQRDSEEALARFRQELALARQIVHANVVRVYDFGTHEGTRFMTMELLIGMDLRHWIRERERSVVEIVDTLVHACSGLQAAHDQGVVHRDIKPENFFVTQAGVLKVMDFGIAKRQDTRGPTMHGTTAGTPVYMSPEQIRGFSSVTTAADVYSLGIVAYEMLTGNVPFDHEDIYPLMMMHVSDPVPPIDERKPGVPSDLQELVLQMLEKKPAERPKSCREIGKRLVQIRMRLVAEGHE